MKKWTVEQQKAIYESGCDILVSAGAGSGKTAVLTERVIEKLKSKIHIDELLILTFTNAAASEMRERIRNRIKEETSLKNELERIDTAYITTFDSFSLSILKKYHYKENISKNVNIISNTLILDIKKQFIDEIFNEYYELKDERFLNLLKTFTIKDDKQIKELILSLSNKLDQEVDKENTIKNYMSKYYGNEFIEILKKDYIFLLEQVKSEILDLLELLSKEVDGTYLEKISTVVEQIFETNVISRLPMLPKESSDEAKKIKEKIKNKLDDYLNLQEDTIENMIIGYKKTSKYVLIILEIVSKLDSKLIKFKQEKDVYEFIDIEKIATRLVLENEDIRIDLKNKFKEIMIDEYQDTNDLQEYFISLIKNNNCYMVGDIKQSIYRFRNANPDIFKNKYEMFSKDINGIKIDMNKNFRSREEVINNINQIFIKLMNLKYGGADYVSLHQMFFGNNEYIEKHPNNDYDMSIYTYQDTKNKEIKEATIIALDIQKKIKEKYPIIDKETGEVRPITYNDFAILLDRTTMSFEYKKIFEHYQIPLNILKDTSILDNDLLQIINNIVHLLFKVIKGCDIRFYFTSIARSFLYEYSDSDIFEIITSKKIKETEIYQNILKLKSIYTTLTPSMLITKIIDLFDIENKLYKIGDLNEHFKLIDTVLELCSELENMGYNSMDLETILDDIYKNGLDLKIASPKSGKEGVSFMTIHKSKGLEFSICYFASLTKKFNISDLNELFLYDKQYGIITPYYDEGIRETFVKRLLKEKYISEEISEKIRLFYVALTRAKEKMIFVCPCFDEQAIPPIKDVRSFYDLLLTISPLLKNKIEEITIDSNNVLTNDIKEEILGESIIVKEHYFKEEIQNKEVYSKKNLSILSDDKKENINLGLKLHEVFEQTDFLNPKTNEYKNYIDSFLNLDILKNIKEAQIFKEYEFIFTLDDKKYHGIIDLMLVYHDHIDIIDYKLSEINDKAYIKQLLGYKKYIENKTKKEVNIYLYSILNNEIEKVIT